MSTARVFGVECDKTRAFFTSCEGNFAGKAATDAMGVTTGLQGGGDGLLGGVGGTEAITVVVLVLSAGVLGVVRGSKTVGAMLGDTKDASYKKITTTSKRKKKPSS